MFCIWMADIRDLREAACPSRLLEKGELIYLLLKALFPSNLFLKFEIIIDSRVVRRNNRPLCTFPPIVTFCETVLQYQK